MSKNTPPLSQRSFSSSSVKNTPPKNVPSNSPSRRHSTAKLAASPLKDTFKPSPDKTKILALSLVLHQSPLSNLVVLMNSSAFPTHTTSRDGVPNFAVDTSDYDLLSEVHKHLVSENSLALPGGDVSRDLYKYTHSDLDSCASSVHSGKRRLLLFSLGERRGSLALGINVPGGFRREFLLKKKKEEQRLPLVGEPWGEDSVELPPFLTRNFVEFLSIYGHFAGEELEDADFQTCTLLKSQLIPEDEENAPLLGASRASLEPARTATPTKAFFLLLKSFVGTGILFLPKAFLNGGLVFLLVTLSFFAMYLYWCYYILIRTKDAMRVSSFGEMGMRLYGPTLKNLIILSIVMSQIGFVGAYLVFTLANLQAFLHNVFGWEVGTAALILVQCGIFVPLSLIRNITRLLLSLLVANAFIFIGLVVIVYYTGIDLAKYGAAETKAFNSESWSLFIGVAIFAFEGIGLIIPIQELMIEPAKFPKVLFAVIATVTALMLLVGTLCYATYGDATNTVIILNLPQDLVMVNSVQLFYLIAILLSAPLQLFPVIKILENKVFGRSYQGKTSTLVKWLKNTLRASLVIVCCVIAYYGLSNLDRFVSFIGCFACIPLVYMYPPMLHYKVVKTQWEKRFDIFLVGFGAAAMIYVLQQMF